MRDARRSCRWLAAAFALVLWGSAPAGAFEAHNFIEPPFGEFIEMHDVAVDEATGNIFVTDGAFEHEEVKVYGHNGGAPAGGGPSSFVSAGSFGISGKPFGPTGIVIDSARGYIYVSDEIRHVVERYMLNGSHQYEFLCEFQFYGAGDRCLSNGGEEKESTEPAGTRLNGRIAIDAAGDVYTGAEGSSEDGSIFEFSPTGEALQVLQLPSGEGALYIESLTVASNGTIYAKMYNGNRSDVVEFKRSSLTGPVEGTPSVMPKIQKANALAFDRANGQLFVDFESYGEALNGAGEVVSVFGHGAIAVGVALAVDEATGEVYVTNHSRQKIDRFGPGLVAALPAVDSPPPSLADVTRTAALISPTINSGNATTSWQLEYVAASEYQPGAANPYAIGGATPLTKLAPTAEGVNVGPVPLSGMRAGTTYHYRLLASNELGTTYGPDHTFTTAPATPPIVTTGPASEVTQTGVLLTGTVNTQELQTSYEFEVGTDTSYKGAKLFGNTGNAGTEAVSASLQFLIPGTSYHYRLVASNEDGTTYGQDVTFTTPGVSAPISQPTALAFVPAPTGAFPSLAGAITKPPGSHKAAKKKRKRHRVRARARHRHHRR